MTQQPKLDPIRIYTDGACRGNPGPGGYGVVLESELDAQTAEFKQRLTAQRVQVGRVLLEGQHPGW